MYRYHVIDTNKSSRLIALRDPVGRCHVAHCTSDMPEIEAALDGDLPAVGFALLIGEAGKAIRLIFSHVNCGELWALGLLHPEHAPAQQA
jgi:hypothetical protein